MGCLVTLPPELLSKIIIYINFDDVCNLGQTCTKLQSQLKGESLCKIILQSKARYSSETIAANALGHYASALRRIAKRREAFANLSPFSVTIVGVGDEFLYCKGVLCYTIDHKLRILDLHGSSHLEIVISIPDLLICVLTHIEDNTIGKFQILYYSDNIISCIYKSKGLSEPTWLIAFDIRNKDILLVKDLISTDKIFSRHNERFLYFGTHSELDVNGYKTWVIQGYNFEDRKWFSQQVHLQDLVGSEIGQTICFEIYHGYFYATSNETSFEVEEIDWTSFYNCLRFPLESPCKDLLEKTENKTMWRRQHQEGPIDDRWTSLRLDVDEATGKLNIVESRKEWHQGSSRYQRTNYKTEIKFPELPYKTEFELLQSSTKSQTVSSASSAATLVFSNSTDSQSSVSSSSSSLLNPSNTSGHDLSTLPDERLVRLLTKDDNPHHIVPPARLAKNTHPGDDDSSLPVLAETPIQYYHTTANTFFDLVYTVSDDNCEQRLRLRAGSRKLRPVLTNSENGLIRDPSSDLPTALGELYQELPVKVWPQDSDLPELHSLLNPPSHLGNVRGTADERSLVYAIGARNAPQAIIFVSFDPAIKLARFNYSLAQKPPSSMPMKGVGESPYIDGRAIERHSTSVEHLGRNPEMRTTDLKGKGNAERSNPASGTAPQLLIDVEGNVDSSFQGAGQSWACKERAMYQDIDQTYWLGYYSEAKSDQEA